MLSEPVSILLIIQCNTNSCNLTKRKIRTRLRVKSIESILKICCLLKSHFCCDVVNLILTERTIHVGRRKCYPTLNCLTTQSMRILDKSDANINPMEFLLHLGAQMNHYSVHRVLS